MFYVCHLLDRGSGIDAQKLVILSKLIVVTFGEQSKQN